MEFLILSLIIILLALEILILMKQSKGLKKNEIGLAQKSGLLSIRNNTSLETSIQFDSPIRKLNFIEALDLNKFYSEIEVVSKNKFEDKIINHLDLSKAIKTFQLQHSVKVVENGKIIFTLTDKSKRLLREGKAELIFTKEGGKLLPVIRDPKNKKFIEIFKGQTANLPAKIANIANVVVNLAHIVSGADLAKKMIKIDKKLNYLLAARKIDQFSKLEANYKLAREILNTSLSENDIQELLRLHRENIELRSTLVREIEYKLSQIELPENYSIIKSLFKRQKMINKEIDQEVTALESELKLIDFSLTYDIALCDSFDKNSNFINITLKDELHSLSRIGHSIKKYQKFIKEEVSPTYTKNIINYINDTIKKYELFIPEKRTEENAEILAIDEG